MWLLSQGVEESVQKATLDIPRAQAARGSGIHTLRPAQGVRRLRNQPLSKQEESDEIPQVQATAEAALIYVSLFVFILFERRGGERFLSAGLFLQMATKARHPKPRIPSASPMRALEPPLVASQGMHQQETGSEAKEPALQPGTAVQCSIPGPKGLPPGCHG